MAIILSHVIRIIFVIGMRKHHVFLAQLFQEGFYSFLFLTLLTITMAHDWRKDFSAEELALIDAHTVPKRPGVFVSKSRSEGDRSGSKSEGNGKSSKAGRQGIKADGQGTKECGYGGYLSSSVYRGSSSHGSNDYGWSCKSNKNNGYGNRKDSGYGYGYGKHTSSGNSNGYGSSWYQWDEKKWENGNSGYQWDEKNWDDKYESLDGSRKKQNWSAEKPDEAWGKKEKEPTEHYQKLWKKDAVWPVDEKEQVKEPPKKKKKKVPWWERFPKGQPQLECRGPPYPMKIFDTDKVCLRKLMQEKKGEPVNIPWVRISLITAEFTTIAKTNTK